MNKQNTVILIDGHSLAYRSYFALERTGMRNSQNIPTWAVYGFFKAFFDLISHVKPDAIAVSFDVSRKTFRNEKFEDYKAHRPPMPDEMKQQMGNIRRGIETLNIPIFEKEGFEADDVIGTLCRKIITEGNKAIILTGDKDSFQLLDNENVKVLIPYQGELIEYNKNKVHEKMGIYPEQVIDYKALRGDTSDNIPGVKGIGDKTAVTLLNEYNDLDNIYLNIEKITKKRTKSLLLEHKEMAYLSKDLATIKTDVEVGYEFKSCCLEIPKLDDFLEFLKEMEFRKFIRELPGLFKDFNNSEHVQISVFNGQVTVNHTKPEDKIIEAKNVEPKVKKEENLQVAIDSQGQMKLGFIEPAEIINPLENLQIIDTEEKFQTLIQTLQSQKVIALDTETSSLNALQAELVGISISWSESDCFEIKDGRLITNDAEVDCHSAYIPLGHDYGTQIGTGIALNHLQPIIEDNTIAKVLHNAKYDMHILKNYDIQINNVILDTILASYVADSNERHGLKDLSMRIFQHVMQEYTDLAGKGAKQVPLSSIEIEKVANYACSDTFMTLKLAYYYMNKLNENELDLLYNIEMSFIPVLFEMERNGISLDVDYLKELSKEIDSSLVKLEEDIYSESKYPTKFNLNSPKQLGEVLFQHMGIPTGAKTKTKSGFSTSAKVLENLASEHKIAKLILDYRHLSKLKSTYIDALPKLVNPDTGRLHTTFNQTGTTTGRLSSSDPNLQNIPIRTEIGNRIRKAFVPINQEESLLLSADYSQIELRFLADISNEPVLIDSFNSNADIHSLTASKIYDVSLEEVTKDMRRCAKSVNFGIVYGQTPYGLSETLSISPKEAKAFIQMYFKTYPKVKEYMDKIIQDAHKDGYVETKFGRKRYLSGELDSRNKSIREFAERAAINSPLQGSAADLIKLASISLFNELNKLNLKSKILLQVHDELILEVPKNELQIVKPIIEKSMVNVCKISVPLVIDLNVGSNWMESK